MFLLVFNSSSSQFFDDVQPFALPFAMKFGSSLRPLSLVGLNSPLHDLILGI